MKIKVKNINAYTKEVSLDIPWVTLEPDFNKAVKSFSKKVKLPGFRPGKIPKDRLMQQFQPNIEAQFMDDNIHKYYLTALQEEKIVPVNQAEISNVSFKMDENFSFTAKFEVEPDFNLPKFKNNMFKVQKNKFIPDDQDKEDAINQLRRSHARIETVDSKPMFRDAYHHRRCLVPADGWYEWKTTPRGKVPFYHTLDDQMIVLMAGIYEQWKSDDGLLSTFTLLTRDASPDIEHIHNRMPVLITPNEGTSWMERSLLSPTPSNILVHPVGREVNKTTAQGPQLIQRIRTLFD